MEISNEMPIGIFDSGVGGLTVMKEIMELLPYENILYLGDTARVPYGTRSAETVTKYSLENMKFLMSRGIKILVVACNTSSSVSLDLLRDNFPGTVVGVVEPGAKAAVAAADKKDVAVIGTATTISTGAYEKAIKAIDSSIHVSGIACPLFVPMIEEGWLSGDVVRLTAEKYLSPIKSNGAGSVVLGCTHYPMIKNVISDVLNIPLIDSAVETAREVRSVLEKEGMLRGADTEAERKFLESEKKYQFIYENTPFSIVLIDSKGRIIDCNPTTEIMFGYLKTELVGKKFHKLKAIHPDYLLNLITVFKKFIKGENVHRIDLEMYKKDKSLIWVNLQASLIQKENEYFIQALFTDITKRKEAEFLVNKEVLKMKELEQMRKNLISIVAHELKTPLASVCGGTELLTTVYGKDLDSKALEITSLIDRGGKRLTDLVNNLIDISRIDYDKFKLEKRPSDLCKLISDSTKEIMHLIERRKLTLNLNLPDPIILNIDKVRLKEVFFNLLSNAIKNTPPNGKIIINVETKDNCVTISVTDSGVGLTSEEMDIIFTRFGKIERSGEGLEYINIQGSGLGLFISKEIINLHDGNIKAESEGRNKGSSFIIKLPST